MTIRVVHEVEGHPLAAAWETIVPTVEQTEENLQKIGLDLLTRYGQLKDAVQELQFTTEHEVTYRVTKHTWHFSWA